MPVGTAYMKDYFADNARFVEQYGEKTILLKQCGAFWEMYGLAQEDGSISGSAMAEIARITDLKIANRLGSQTHKMIGFGLASRDKYVGKMMNAGYTVPIMPQVRPGTNSEHYLEMVVTPGTSFVDNEFTLSRHTACLWLEKLSNTLSSSTRPNILCGMSWWMFLQESLRWGSLIWNIDIKVLPSMKWRDLSLYTVPQKHLSFTISLVRGYRRHYSFHRINSLGKFISFHLTNLIKPRI